jgi:hypothetical protein
MDQKDYQMNLFITGGVSVNFVDGQPTSVTWSVEFWQNSNGPNETLRNNAEAILRMCGFMVRVEKPEFVERNNHNDDNDLHARIKRG